MQQLTFQISAFTEVTEDLVINVYEEQAPEAIVWSETLEAPHDTIRTVISIALDLIPHRVKLIGVTSNIEYGNFVKIPFRDVVTFYAPIKFVIGDGSETTPTGATNEYTNPDLIDLVPDVDFIYNRNGLNQIYGTHYNFDPATGKIILLAIGDQWNADPADQVWITRQPKSVTQAVNDSVVGKLFGGFVDAPGAVSYIPFHLRKLVRLAPASAYTFMLATPVPIGYSHSFTQMGAAGSATINFLNAALKWQGGLVTSFSLTQNSTATFSFDGVNWNCVAYADNSNILPAYAKIVYANYSILGNPTTDQYYNIGIPLQTDTNYIIIGTMRGASVDPNQDNDVSWVTYGKTVNGFSVAVREYAAATQNLIFDYILVRIN